jgi:hypothetical protein
MGKSAAVVSFGLVMGLCAAGVAGCGGGGDGGKAGFKPPPTLGGGGSGATIGNWPPIQPGSGGAGWSAGSSTGASTGTSAGSSSGSSAGSSSGSSAGSSSGSSSGSSVGASTGWSTGSSGGTIPGSSSGSSTGGSSGGSAGGSSGASSGSSSGTTTGGSGGSSTGGSTGSSSGSTTGSSSGGSTSGGSSGGSTSGGGSSSNGGGGGGGVPLTYIYINSGGGSIYRYDSANWSLETEVVRSTGAFSISSGPRANTLYLQISSFSSGPLEMYDLVTRSLTHVGGDVPGNAFGEGRNGFLYAGSGYGLYRVDPNSGSSTYVGDGRWGYAGDLAVDPTSDILYGAVEGQWTVDLVVVDRASGDQRVVGPLGVSGDIWGLGFSRNGDLFAAGPDGSGAGAIYQIDKTSGRASPVRRLNYEPYDMATQPYDVAETDHSGGGGVASAAPASREGVLFEEDFDGGAAAIRWSGTRVWEAGAPTAGPNGAASGARCMATRVQGGYPGYCLDTVETPPIDLSKARRPVLVIRHWYDVEDERDGGAVRVRASRGEATLEPARGYPRRGIVGLEGGAGFSGRSRAWVVDTFDLSAFAGEREVRIGFTFGSDDDSRRAGWFVDDIVVAEEGAAPTR